MAQKAPQRPELGTEESRVAAVDFRGKLDQGETLTGTPSVSEVGTNSLVLGTPTISTEELIINGSKVPAGLAVQFTAAAPQGKPGTSLTALIECPTSAGQTLANELEFLVV